MSVCRVLDDPNASKLGLSVSCTAVILGQRSGVSSRVGSGWLDRAGSLDYVGHEVIHAFEIYSALI